MQSPPRDALGPHGKKGDGIVNPTQGQYGIVITEHLILNISDLLTELVREDMTMIAVRRYSDIPLIGIVRPMCIVFVTVSGKYLPLTLLLVRKIISPSKFPIEKETEGGCISRNARETSLQRRAAT